MGGSLEGNQKETSHSIKNYFDELFAYFLSIGMSSHEFWDEDVDLVNFYVKAEKYRQTKLNNQLWIEGIYIRLAIGSCLSKGVKYPEKPIPLTEHDKELEMKVKVERFKKALMAKAKK